MPLRSLLAGLALLVACPAHAGEPDVPAAPLNTAPLRLWDQAAAGPAPTRVLVGDRAPLFSYLGTDGRWHRFEDLAERGPILLVFGASEEDLRAFEEARPAFRELDLVPVFVMDRRSGSIAALERRLGLSEPLIADPKRAIADLYNSLDPRSLRHAPAFFVLDRERTIRALGRGSLPPVPRMLDVSARVLGKPLPPADGAQPSG